MEAPDPYTAVLKLKKPNSRFHALFTVRWNAVWIMPKHVFEKVEDPLKFDFNKPVSLGAYVLSSYDPDGKWYIWKLRDDWQRTSLGRFGKPGPTYLAYVDAGPPDKRDIAQMKHELDVIHDIAPEGMFALARQSKTSRGWFKAFPFAHLDPTLVAVMFNTQNELFKNRDVRWALALLIDIKAVSMASYRGAATIAVIGVPPTGAHRETYHGPMQDWLKAFEIDTGMRKIKPYDPTIGQQIAEMLRPSMGEQIPTDPKEIAKTFGMGWWKPDPQAAQELLERAGFTKRGNSWDTPDGKSFSVRVVVEGEARPVMARAGSMIVQQWRQFGIDAKIDTAQGTLPTRRSAGDFDTMISWSVETWGGHQDLSFFLDSWHSQFVAPPGSPQPPRNWQRWSNPDLDRIIEQIRSVAFDDPKGIGLGKEYIKLVAREMPTIPLMSYNVFTAMDETYWTGYPVRRQPVRESGPKLGELAVHAREAEAEGLRRRDASDARLSAVFCQTLWAVPARGLHRHQPRLRDHARYADRSDRTVDGAGDVLRQLVAGGDRSDASVAARDLRPDARANIRMSLRDTSARPAPSARNGADSLRGRLASEGLLWDLQ